MIVFNVNKFVTLILWG